MPDGTQALDIHLCVDGESIQSIPLLTGEAYESEVCTLAERAALDRAYALVGKMAPGVHVCLTVVSRPQ